MYTSYAPVARQNWLYKHTPEAPRLRLLLPLKREVTEDEYPALGRMVAKEIGIDLFDDTTYHKPTHHNRYLSTEFGLRDAVPRLQPPVLN